MVSGGRGIACPKSRLCCGGGRLTDSHPYIAQPACKEMSGDLAVVLSLKNDAHLHTQFNRINYLRKVDVFMTQITNLQFVPHMYDVVCYCMCMWLVCGPG